MTQHGCDSCFLLKNNIVSHFYTQNVENPLIVIYLYMQVVRGLFFFSNQPLKEALVEMINSGSSKFGIKLVVRLEENLREIYVFSSRRQRKSSVVDIGMFVKNRDEQ
jgi:hypothetical protein